jgi:hypothetical protein
MVDLARFKLEGLQQMMVRWEQLAPFNAVQMVVLQGQRLSIYDVREAVGKLMNESGTCSFTVMSGRRFAEWTNGASLPEVSLLSVDEMVPEFVEAFIRKELSVDLSEVARCPFRFTLIDTGGSKQGLAVTYRHAVSDAHGTAVMLHRLLLLFKDGNSGKAWRLTPPTIRELFPEFTHRTRFLQKVRNTIDQYKLFFGCWRPPRRFADNWDTDFVIADSGLSSVELVQNARRQGSTVQELLFAALADALGSIFPESRSTGAIAINTLVNLRQFRPEQTDGVVGQLLGGLNVRVDVNRHTSFEDRLGAVKQQVRNTKEEQTYLNALSSFETMAALWDLLPHRVSRDLTPRLFPVAAGISNVKLSEGYSQLEKEGIVTDYFRATNLGLMLPLMVTLTTCGSVFSLTATYRRSVFTQDDVAGILNHVQSTLLSTEGY